MPPRLYYDAKNPGLVTVDRPFYRRLAETGQRTLIETIVVPIRTGRAWPVRTGQLCRIVASEGPQVCDFNAWNLHNPRERFWAARSRQFEGAHVTTYKRLWSCLPYLRPILTITNDTLPTTPTPSGGRCHDLLGSRCDPYLYKLQNGTEFNLTCHNNLARAVAPYHLTELDVHDVLNIFQITGLDPVNEIYFTEPSPARKGDRSPLCDLQLPRGRPLDCHARAGPRRPAADVQATGDRGVRRRSRAAAGLALARTGAALGLGVLGCRHDRTGGISLADRIIVMSARPGRVKASIQNDLPRPRQVAVQLSPRYLELKTRIWGYVEEEVRQQIEATARPARGQ